MPERTDRLSCVTFEASRAVWNPWYEFPNTLGRGNAAGREVDITSPCRVDLSSYGGTLILRQNAIDFLFCPASRLGQLINPIRYFVSYSTFIDYNISALGRDVGDPDSYPRADPIRFQVQRVVRIEKELEGGMIGLYHEGEDTSLEIPAGRFEQFLRALDETLFYAMTFYLIGCENQRYFLVEFYKAVEVVVNAFDDERAFLAALAPYGISRKKFRIFRMVCNDMRIAPLDIGRHAPVPGAPLYSTDLRYLLVEERSREVVVMSTEFCREVIDAYMQFRLRHP